MVTPSSGAPETIVTAFDFSKHMRNPTFRAEFNARGWLPEHDIVVTTDDEQATSLIGRMMANQTSSPCMILWGSPTDADRLLFMFATSEPGSLPSDRKRVSLTEISATTSVGMIYDSMAECGDFVPHEWGAPIRFAADAPAH